MLMFIAHHVGGPQIPSHCISWKPHWYGVQNDYSIVLTPSNDGDDDNVLCCNTSEDNNEFLEHEHGFGCHPGYRCHGEILDEQ